MFPAKFIICLILFIFVFLELSCAGKVQRVLWHYIGKPILLLVFLYLFICSLSFLGDAFKLLGGKVLGACKTVLVKPFYSGYRLTYTFANREDPKPSKITVFRVFSTIKHKFSASKRSASSAPKTYYV